MMDRLDRRPLEQIDELRRYHQHEHTHLDWLAVAEFDIESTRDIVNRAEFVRELRCQPILPPPLEIECRFQGTGDVIRVAVLVHPYTDFKKVDELLDLIEEEGHINADLYWAAIRPLQQSCWDEAALETRIDWIQRSLTADLKSVLDRTPPAEVMTQIWQDLDD